MDISCTEYKYTLSIHSKVLGAGCQGSRVDVCFHEASQVSPRAGWACMAASTQQEVKQSESVQKCALCIAIRN